MEKWYSFILFFLSLYNLFDCFEKYRLRKRLSIVDERLLEVKTVHNNLVDCVYEHLEDTDIHLEG